MMKQLIRDQYRDKLSQITDFKRIIRPKEGWIRTTRKALGMSGPQLAKRMKLSNSQISQMERLEVQDRITLKQLRKAADTLNCDLVYGFVPRKEITDIIKDQATKKAHSLVNRADLQMKLESQQLTKENLEQQIQREVARLLQEMPRTLWEE